MLHLQYPPHRETQIPLYKFESNQQLNLNLYCEILRNLSFTIWWISGVAFWVEIVIHMCVWIYTCVSEYTHVCLNIHMCVWIEPYDTDKHFEKPATYMCVCVCVCVRVSKKNPPTCVFVWKEPCNTHENSEKSPTIHMHVWKEPYNTQVCLKRTNEPLNTHAYSENSP